MNPRLRAKLDSLVGRLGDLERLLAAENATRDMEQFRRLSREHSEVSNISCSLSRPIGRRNATRHEARDLAADAAMKVYADEELKKARAAMERLEAELQKALLPKDPNDERNLFVEVRAGTGGDESALFAGDLFRMYTRFAERKGWQVEIISESASELGGYKEVIARIVGQGAFSRLKFESGGHRVQRVPKTEAQGRIHTSACTVAVLPEADAIEDGRAQSRRAAHRHLPRLRRRRPARQQDRFGDPRHPSAHRYRGRVPGLALAAQEPREGAQRARGAHPRQAGARAAGEDRLDAQVADRLGRPLASASAPTTSRRAASPTTASI